MIIILTKPPKLFFKGCVSYYFKSTAKKIIGRKRGPDVVIASLTRGLNTLKIPYKINTPPNKNDIVHVPNNIAALKWAIEQKKLGNISRLVAGPNLVTFPNEAGVILKNDKIDLILIVSEWTEKLYKAILPIVAHKIKIWPAGVAIPETKIIDTTKRNSCIVFKKDVPEALYLSVINELQKRQIPIIIIEYGSYTQSDYFNALKKSSFMIYLQKVESQGIALQEAWAHDVPTLVWGNQSFFYPNGYEIKGNITAPFLTKETGIFFDDAHDFPKKLTEMTSHLSNFKARQYCAENLSDEASARIYAKILGLI